MEDPHGPSSFCEYKCGAILVRSAEPCSNTSSACEMRGEDFMSKSLFDNWNLCAMQEQYHSTRYENSECQRKQQPFVALHLNAENREMADDSSQHHSQR